MSFYTIAFLAAMAVLSVEGHRGGGRGGHGGGRYLAVINGIPVVVNGQRNYFVTPTTINYYYTDPTTGVYTQLPTGTPLYDFHGRLVDPATGYPVSTATGLVNPNVVPGTNTVIDPNTGLPIQRYYF